MTLAHKLDSAEAESEDSRKQNISKRQIYTIHTYPDNLDDISQVPEIDKILSVFESNELYAYTKSGTKIKKDGSRDESLIYVMRVDPEQPPEIGGVVLYDSQVPPKSILFFDLPNLYVNQKELILENPPNLKLNEDYSSKYWSSLVGKIRKELKEVKKQTED